jgi:hypothetical protein
MEKRPILPEQRNYEQAISQALKIACDELANADIPEVCRKSGAHFQQAQKTMAIDFLKHPYLVTLPSVDVSIADSTEKVNPREKLLVLHYLINAKGTSLKNRTVTIKEIPDGMNYYPTFVKRALKPIMDTFGNVPATIFPVASKLGGIKAEFGDAAMTIKVFPNVPVTFVVWQGDEEFPPWANILFDASVTDYLPAEDIIVLSEITAWRLVRLAK